MMENDEPQPPLAAFVIEPIDITTNQDRILGSTNKRRPSKVNKTGFTIARKFARHENKGTSKLCVLDY